MIKIINFIFLFVIISSCSHRIGPKIRYYEKDGEQWSESKIYYYPEGKKKLVQVDQYKGNQLYESKVFYEIWPNGDCKFISKEGFNKYINGKSNLFNDSIAIPDNIIVETSDSNNNIETYYYMNGERVPYTLGKRDGIVETIYAGDNPGVYRWENGKKIFVRELNQSDNEIKNKIKQEQNGYISPIFDLSPDGKNIVIAISKRETSFLYQYSLTDKSLTQLTDKNGEYHSRPVYSPKGDKVIFLSKDLEKQKSDICLLDIHSKEIVKITNGETYITEAIFNPNGDRILYCGAEFLGSYSPIARKAPHDLDLYSIALDATDKQKLTNLSAYELSSISMSQSGDSILCKLTEKDFNGIYLMSLSDTTIIQKIEAVNNPRPQIGNSFYNNPVYSKDYKNISFTAPYQLYTLNLESKECEEIWSTFGKDNQAMVIFSRFFNSNDKIIFSILRIENRQYSRNAELLIVDLKTKKTTEIEIK
ncbi:MAG: hypothetical protein KAT68_02715 [Bacteroidales bacterium]|nr:hypothetical protein [Bacteroidales bacterium]